MKVTKYEHACLVLEDQGKKIAVDPGQFSGSFPVEKYDVAIITHVHGDHLDVSKLQAIMTQNTALKIYTVKEVADELKKSNLAASVVEAGQKVAQSGFDIEFFGGEHAIIHPDWPTYENVGILVNNKLYYPGDSFVAPGKPIDTLAVPTSAPWLKTQEYMDFVKEIKPKQCFPTHDALLSEIGAKTTNNWLAQMCEKVGVKFIDLGIGQSLEI